MRKSGVVTSVGDSVSLDCTVYFGETVRIESTRHFCTHRFVARVSNVLGRDLGPRRRRSSRVSNSVVDTLDFITTLLSYLIIDDYTLGVSDVLSFSNPSRPKEENVTVSHTSPNTVPVPTQRVRIFGGTTPFRHCVIGSRVPYVPLHLTGPHS